MEENRSGCIYLKLAVYLLIYNSVCVSSGTICDDASSAVYVDGNLCPTRLSGIFLRLPQGGNFFI